MLRTAAVAGQFYPGHRDTLLQSITALTPFADKKKPAIGIMSPHAGYVYSGAVAGKAFACTRVPNEIIVLGPNHHGRGHAAAVYVSGSWETPLGQIGISAGLAERILQECPMTAGDPIAHQFEHSLEVQVPFIQYAAPHATIVPICIRHLSLELLLELGNGIARAASACDELPLLVASTDMTHYEAGQIARKKDFMALDKVLSLDPAGLYYVVAKNRISMCGVLPTVVMLQAALALGATGAELVAYSNSGDVTGDQSEVVGYAGVRVY